MTNKDYEILVNVFRNRRPNNLSEGDAVADMYWNLVNGLCFELKMDNPRFNADKFKGEILK